MRLYTNPGSPFGRKVKVVAIETGLIDRLAIVDATLSPVAPDAAVSAANPLGKIPCLVLDDGEALYDSRVVCEFLDAIQEGEPLLPAEPAARRRVLVRQALADGMMDAAVSSRYERVLRPAATRWPDWLAGQRRKIDGGLDRLEGEASGLSELADLGAIAAACALGYLDFRFADEPWRDGRPRLAAWYERVAARPSMGRSRPG